MRHFVSKSFQFDVITLKMSPKSVICLGGLQANVSTSLVLIFHRQYINKKKGIASTVYVLEFSLSLKRHVSYVTFTS